MIWIREWLFNTSVAIVLAATIILIWRAFNPPITFRAQPEAVAALRVPPQAMSNLHTLSQWYDIPFDQLLAMYAVANDFFPKGPLPAIELNELKSNYVAGFNRLRRQYSARDMRPFFELFHNLLEEIEYFPIPLEYEYMFSDTWGPRQGTDILDRENIRGRIPILSMTSGNIHQAGWHSRQGYHVVVITQSGSRFLYAHLDSLDITTGQQIEAGQKLGTMGNSGTESFIGIPVHLHIAISPKVPFAENFWINPYPFLRHLEEASTQIF